MTRFSRSHDAIPFMAKNIAVVIREDPRQTHRPVEALRIALGLVAGSHETTVVLLGESVRLLYNDTDDIIDVDVLEKYLPSIQQLKIPFIITGAADCASINPSFSIRYETPEMTRLFVHSMDRTLVF